ncbi:MAG: 30S ribosomal protein S18 [Clostridia bacterium]|nr:30S ribosomal protein S18 [Clostridia bacterium]
MPYAKKENKGKDVNDKGDVKTAPRFRKPRKKVCPFCVEKAENIDYKDVAKLRKFVSERGKILPRRISGACAKHQRQLTTAIKRARHVALLPFQEN